MSVDLRIVEVRIGDDPDSWRRAGFAIDREGCAQVSSLRLRFVGSDEGRGITRWALSGVASSAVDGLAGEVAAPGAPVATGAPVVHPNTTIVLDHLVIATPDVSRTVDAFRALGCEPRREREAGTESAPLRQVFVRAGEVIIEIVGPRKPTPGSRAAKHAAASFWGLAFTVADLDACVATLGDHCGSARDAVQPGRRIATLRHEPLGISVPTAFMSATSTRASVPSDRSAGSP